MKNLGRLETQFFAYIQMRRLKVVRTGDMVKALRWSVVQERKTLSRLQKACLIARVKRGIYLVPPRLPLGAAWTPGEALALNTLMTEVGGRYQICGPSAFNQYGFSEQVPNRLYAYNNRLTGSRKVGAVTLSLIEVADKRLGETETFSTDDEGAAVYSSRVRTLFDAVYDWSRFRVLPAAYRWIGDDLKQRRVTAENLIAVTVKYGDTGTIRRIGFFLETLGVPAPLLRRLKKALRPSSGFIPWIPGKPRRGTVNRTWGIIVNGTVALQ